jgi:hypothetical protein
MVRFAPFLFGHGKTGCRRGIFVLSRRGSSGRMARPMAKAVAKRRL